ERRIPPELVTDAGAGIGEALPCFRDELPVVGAGLKSKFQDAEGGGIAHFAVGLWFAEGTMVFAAGADDEFADAAWRIGNAIGSLRCEALVIMVMAADDYVGIGFIESLPESLHSQIVSMRAAGTE